MCTSDCPHDKNIPAKQRTNRAKPRPPFTKPLTLGGLAWPGLAGLTCRLAGERTATIRVERNRKASNMANWTSFPITRQMGDSFCHVGIITSTMISW